MRQCQPGDLARIKQVGLFLGIYSGIMLFLEIQIGKVEIPKWSERHQELGATASCTLRATTTMANYGQKEQLHHRNLI
jgi:hypothetical protein